MGKSITYVKPLLANNADCWLSDYLFAEDATLNEPVRIENIMQDLHKTVPQINNQLRRERLLGFPICTVMRGRKPGYYIAEDWDEMEQYIKLLDKEIDGLEDDIRNLKGLRYWALEFVASGLLNPF